MAGSATNAPAKVKVRNEIETRQTVAIEKQAEGMKVWQDNPTEGLSDDVVDEKKDKAK